jgi:hypothetical protein
LNLKGKVIDKAMYRSFFTKDISFRANNEAESTNTIDNSFVAMQNKGKGMSL